MAFPVVPVLLSTVAAATAALIGYRYVSGGGEVAPFLSFGDPVSQFAAQNQIDPRIVQAVLSVESGDTALVSGKPVIRVEVHRLEREAAKSGQLDQLRTKFGRNSEPGKPWTGHLMNGQPLHGQRGETLAQSQRREHEALRFARELLGDEPALRSTSIGLGQVMGFNAEAAGFPSALAMYEDAKRGRDAQRLQFLQFLANDRNGQTLAALKDGNLALFGQFYNGAKVGTAQNRNYVGKLKAAMT